MKNPAMQHAIANAEKARRVPKGTLSLAGENNKRSTDADAQKTMPEAAEAALAAAAQALHDGGIKERESAPEKAAPTAAAPIDLNSIPRVVFRSDVRGNLFCFMVDTMDAGKNTIAMYDMAHGNDKEEVPVDFYRTLKPVTEQRAKDKAFKMMTEKLGVGRLLVRDRLLKSHMLERDTEGKVDEKGIEQLKKNLLQAVEQFRQAILNA